ncbi:MAG TPA: sigma-54 dependent transcriptional regulator [Candidatus Acidoferrales bacterium]|nr:sigma-54 dependent transcriptional regulator [Candidatus Acidoferrales bacterium]
MKSNHPCRILVVDDDSSMVGALRNFLVEEGYAVEGALCGEEALSIQERTPGICLALVDLIMPLTDGLALMDQMKKRNPNLAVVIMTGFGTIETAVEAIKRGAEDYLTKPFDQEAIRKKIGRLMEVFELRGRVAELESNFNRYAPSFESLVHISPIMQQAVEQAQMAAETDAPILLVGETGTGKEMLARAIHWASRRSSAPFAPLNCAALPRELVESELFGVRRGAFTGAYADAAGLFASASGGTVFLDEIGEMPKEVQVKLLRVLQEKELRPIGSPRSLPVDVRIISATNHPLGALRGEFLRSDFYFRIATVTIEVPPLRRRPEDLLALIHHYTRWLSGRYEREITLSRQALELLLHYSFPGNIRELINLLESVAALSRDDPQSISERDLRPLLQSGKQEEIDVSGSEPILTLEQWERMAVERALRWCKGNRTKAASLLGISRDTLYRKLREFKDDA